MSFNPLHGKPLQGGLQPVAAGPAGDVAALTSTQSKTRLLEAVRYAHGLWCPQARFQNIVINGPTAMGPPGCLTGPSLESLIKSAPSVVADQGSARDLRDALARGVSNGFTAWQNALTVPRLPWYPTFAAVPGPVAPPTPNVPMPLATCPSAQTAALSQTSLRQGIVAALPPALRVPAVDTCIGALAQSLATYFTSWLSTQQVTGVMGQGPVPTFAPPAVAVGPVVGGSVLSAPGHLATGSQPRMIVM